MRRVETEEELSLDKIIDSGQCFRPRRLSSGLYRFIKGREILYIRPERGEREFLVSCSREKWERIWAEYFDLGRSYRKLLRGIPEEDGYLRRAEAFGRGIRVLRQDPFEVLISFIISQRKSIPAIRGCIEKLSACCGRSVRTPYEEEPVFLFPSPESIAALSEEELRKLGLGYRAPYLRDAAERTLRGELSAERLSALSTERLCEELLRTRGVGRKVADCVLLFGYGRTERAPIDVWIRRTIEERYLGEDPFPSLPEPGILQQYLFYYAIFHREEFGR